MQEINTDMTATQMAAAINGNFENVAGESLINGWQNKPVMTFGDTSRTTLRVLVLGNSFTNCSTFAIPTILGNAEISSGWSLTSKVGTGVGITDYTYNGTNFTGWWKRIVNNSDNLRSSTLQNSNGWDIVVINQASLLATDWSKYAPEVGYMIDAIRHYGTNKEVKIAFHMSWNRDPSTPQNLPKIYDCAKRLISLYGFDIIIPCATAVENASANNGYVKYDPSGHLTNGLGEYVAAAAWYESIIRPFFGTADLEDSTMLPADGETFTWSGYGSASMTLTRADALLAAKCAKAAVNDMWDVTTIE